MPSGVTNHASMGSSTRVYNTQHRYLTTSAHHSPAMEKTNLELIFIPCPAPGHMVSAVEFANRLLLHDPRFQVTILLMKPHWNLSSSQHNEANGSDSSSPCRLRYINLPEVVEQLPPQDLFKEYPEVYFCAYIASHKPQVKAAIDTIAKNHTSSRLAGIVLDMFCIPMIDVANELNTPSYIFYTSGAAFLGVLLDLPTLNLQFKEDGQADFTDSDPNLQISTFTNPLPAKLLPAPFVEKNGHDLFVQQAKRFPETNGIIVNTFEELEPYAIKSLTSNYDLIPKVYTVGPVLDLKGRSHGNHNDNQSAHIFQWLDEQPDSSVLYLCFGSRGGFSQQQVKEMATGLQQTGVRFLWSLRKPPTVNEVDKSEEYTNTDLKEFLPDVFMSLLEGDEKRGMICGWTPQAEVLAHSAIGGFVSHCGWNSTLESLWFGVPIVTWPLYAEQHCNAFHLVKELGLGVELRIDYRREMGDMVTAAEFQQAVRCVMDQHNHIRNRVKDISEISKQALLDGGSSLRAIHCLIRDMKINLGD